VAGTLLLRFRNLLQSRHPPALSSDGCAVCRERRSGGVLPSTEFSALCCENPAATTGFGQGGLVVVSQREETSSSSAQWCSHGRVHHGAKGSCSRAAMGTVATMNCLGVGMRLLPSLCSGSRTARLASPAPSKADHLVWLLLGHGSVLEKVRTYLRRCHCCHLSIFPQPSPGCPL